MYKFKFSIVAGAIFRSKIRNALYDMKNQLEFRGRTVKINESKSLLDSTFFVSGIATKSEIEGVQRWGRQFA